MTLFFNVLNIQGRKETFSLSFLMPPLVPVDRKHTFECQLSLDKCDLDVWFFFLPPFLHELLLQKKSRIYRKNIYILWRSRKPVFFLYKSLMRMYYNVNYSIYYSICARGVPVWFSLGADSCLKLWSRWLFFELHCHMLFLGINNLTFLALVAYSGCEWRLAGCEFPIKQQKAVAKLPIHTGVGSTYVKFFSHMLTCDLGSFHVFFFLNPRHEIMWSFSLLIPTFCLIYWRTGMRRASISSVEHSADVCLIPMRKNVLISRCQPRIRRMNLYHFLLPLSSVRVDLECL